MIRKIDHVGIAVKSLEEAVKTYEALGFEVEEIEEVAEQKVKVAMLPAGESRIELLELLPRTVQLPNLSHREERGFTTLLLTLRTLRRL